MGFGVRKSGNGEGSNVDWKALNDYMVNTCDLKSPETVIGVVSTIVDLGMQPQDDAAYIWTGTPEEEEAEKEKYSETYFEDMPDYQDGGKVKRFKRFPQKDVQQVCFTIDFPDIMLDKGQFFGEEGGKELPLRMLMGGEFTPKGGSTIVSGTYSLSPRKNEKTNNQWSIPFGNPIYKMAVAAKLVDQGEPFTGERLDELLGKAFLFQCQVALNSGGYLNEKCKFVGGLMKGQKAPDIDDSLLNIIQFESDNSEESLKMLRKSIINTISQSSEFDGSPLKSQLEKAGRLSSDGGGSKTEGSGGAKSEEKAKSKTKPKKIEEGSQEDDESDDPFDV